MNRNVKRYFRIFEKSRKGNSFVLSERRRNLKLVENNIETGGLIEITFCRLAINERRARRHNNMRRQDRAPVNKGYRTSRWSTRYV